MDLSNAKLEFFVGSINLFAIIGALLSSRITEVYGFRGSFIVAAVGFIVGILIMIFSTNFSSLMFGRIFVGLGVGFGMTIGPIYLSEISPKSHRGYFVSWAEIGCNIGILLGFATGLLSYAIEPNLAWRVMYAIGCIMPLMLIVLSMLVMSESPRWLVQKGKDSEALSILRKIYPVGK